MENERVYLLLTLCNRKKYYVCFQKISFLYNIYVKLFNLFKHSHDILILYINNFHISRLSMTSRIIVMKNFNYKIISIFIILINIQC